MVYRLAVSLRHYEKRVVFPGEENALNSRLSSPKYGDKESMPTQAPNVFFIGISGRARLLSNVIDQGTGHYFERACRF